MTSAHQRIELLYTHAARNSSSLIAATSVFLGAQRPSDCSPERAPVPLASITLNV